MPIMLASDFQKVYNDVGLLANTGSGCGISSTGGGAIPPDGGRRAASSSRYLSISSDLPMNGRLPSISIISSLKRMIDLFATGSPS